MDNRLKQQLEEILQQSEVEEQSEALLKQALEVETPAEDGAWLKSTFRLAATFLEMVYGNKRDANRALPWLLFSLGMAYNKGDRNELCSS